MEQNISKQLEILKNSVGNTEKKTESGIAKRMKNLRMWKPGEKVKGAGRPKGQRDYKTIREQAIIAIAKQNGKSPAEIENMLLAKGVSEALKGDFRFYKDDLDRIHGQAVSRTEIGGLEDSNPIRLEIGIQRILDKAYNDDDTN